jgi:2-haloalkanoic acid dehalogenase type II
VPAGTYRAVVFDLLTALLDSWSLWNEVAGSEALGLAWRTRYLVLTYEAGAYRSYEGVIRNSARDAGVPPERADDLIRRWGDVKPWPETREVVSALQGKVPVAVATNASIALARIAVGALGVTVATVVTAEEAGFYKPRPEPYRMALQRLGRPPGSTLFVAGSAADVPGASAVGMPVFWHNRRHLAPVAGGAQPLHVSDSLRPLLDLI